MLSILKEFSPEIALSLIQSEPLLEVEAPVVEGTGTGTKAIVAA